MAIEKTKVILENLMTFLQDFIKKNKYPPSVREICTAMNFKSTATAQYYLNKLTDAGVIKRGASKNRTIELCSSESDEFISVPLLGNVAAGQPLFTQANLDDSFKLPRDFFPTRTTDLFMLRVEGCSMMDAGILNGDMVIIKQQDTANDGDIVVAMVDNEVTLKRYYKYPRYVRLVPENKEFRDIIVDSNKEFRILGRAIGLMRNNIF